MKLETMMFIFPLVFVGIIFQFTPLMTRPGIFFGATVDRNFPQSADGRRVLRSYRWQVTLWSVAVIVVTAMLTPRDPLLGSIAPLFVLIGAVTFTYWRKFEEVHTRYGSSTPEIRRASLSPEHRGESFDSRLWLPPFVALALAILYLHWHWNQIPERFPMRWSSDGRPIGWASRDWLGVYGTLLMAVGFNLFSLGLAWLIARLSRKTTMRYIAVRSLLVLLYPLTFTFIVVSLLPLLQIPARLIPAVILVSVGLTFLVVAGVLYWSYRKVSASAAGEDEVPEPQSDSYWKAGMFYYNPHDPAIFVSKRVGIGYTMNFANKISWVVLVGILLIALLPILLVRK
jgi:uncharacterized membrane protein